MRAAARFVIGRDVTVLCEYDAGDMLERRGKNESDVVYSSGDFGREE